MTVVVTSNNELVVPKSVRRKAGIRTGDKVRFTVSGRVISVVPSEEDATPAERRAVKRGITASEKDYKEGKAFGPFKTHEEFVASLHHEAAKLRGEKK